jgi:hypothetical protein
MGMNLRHGLWTLVLAVGALGCGGCNDDEEGDQDGGVVIPDGGGGGGGELPFSEWCSNVETGFANALLQSEQACGQTAITREDLPRLQYFIGLGLYQLALEELANCNGGHLGTMNEAFGRALQSGRMLYDPVKAFQCRQLGRTTAPGATVDTSVCRQVLVGNVAVGQSCQLHEECVDGTFCNPAAADACAGVCQPRIAQGQPCSPYRQLCVLGLDCRAATPGQYTCQADGESLGAVCDDGNENGPFCRSDLVCSSLTARCIEPQPQGSACGRDDECLSGICIVAGGSGGTGMCGIEAAVGQQCDEESEGLPPCGQCLRCQAPSEVPAGASPVCVPAVMGGACALDAHCPPNSICQAGGCVLRPKPGEACVVYPDDWSGDLPPYAHQGSCLYGDTFCKRSSPTDSAGTCVPLPVLGELCSRDSAEYGRCAEGFCEFAPGDVTGIGTCAPLKGQGESCQYDGDCQDALECSQGSCQPFPAAGEPCTRDCREGAYCDATGTCQPQKAAGTTCEEDEECLTGACDPSTQLCAAPCNDNYSPSCGCPADGARGYSMYLLFALVLLPGLSRRRHRATNSFSNGLDVR